jgi:hypothetical protein
MPGIILIAKSVPSNNLNQRYKNTWHARNKLTQSFNELNHLSASSLLSILSLASGTLKLRIILTPA